MRHLVVARERRVDGGPPSHHVGEHAGHDEVAHEDAERRPHQWVDAASVAARPHVTADGAEGRGPLEDHLPQEQHEGARHVVTVGEECPIARVGLLLRLHPADREDHVLRLAGEKVSAAGAAIDQKADARGQAPLDLGAVRRRRARHERRGLLLHPAEGRDVVVRPQQDPRLTGTRLRGEIGLPLGQTMRVVGQPAGHGRGVAVAHRPAQHGQCEPVDLEEEDPGDVGVGDDPLPARDPSRNAKRVRVVRAEDNRERDAHSGDHERSEKRPAEAVDGEHPVGQVVGPAENGGVREQHQEEAGHERERQSQRGEDGRDDRVQRCDDRRDEQRTPVVVDADTGQEPGGHHQRDAHGKPREGEREHPQTRTLGLPGRGLAVRGLGVAGHHVLLLGGVTIIALPDVCAGVPGSAPGASASATALRR